MREVIPVDPSSVSNTDHCDHIADPVAAPPCEHGFSRGHLPRQRAVVQAEHWMGVALQHARHTPDGDVPVGALVVNPDGDIIAAATNLREATANPTAHAEVLALQEAVNVVGDSWRLQGCTLVVTLEPCAMCAGAIINSRIGEVIFGAYEPKTGAAGSVVDLFRDVNLGHQPGVRGGVLEPQCRAMLEEFFAKLRR